MRRIISAAVFLSCAAMVYFSSCSEQKPKEETSEKGDSCAAPADADINPNKSSELAVLMRRMHDFSQQVKKNIEQSSIIGNFPDEFLKLKTAQPTDEQTKMPSFDGYADSYLQSLKNLFEKNETSLKEKHNAVVNACLACHSDHCGGPVPKIKKLLLK